MYVRIALISLLLCAGCTQDPASTASSSSHSVPGPAGVALGGRGALHATPTRRHSFANLADRGDLVAYPAQRVVREDGAYTWHRAGLSEDHALRAVGGVLQITTPAGERLQFQYERHVEHPSGDWTWIGRMKQGAVADEVILTFGEKAAFGTISQPGKAPLKLTMNGGVSWLIEVDRARIADIDNPATRPRNPDFLVPPKLKMGSGASAASAPTPAPSITSLGAQAAAATVVDVLLGYTNGFAAAQGGQSQAVTRLNNMVEITNQAYANSQLDARIRLVHAMQVSYSDNTSNDGALEALTGFRAPSTRTTPDPAFAALRTARDQYGADLVSLVRDFNTPENDGCGIAWLIGGGQTGIGGSDEYFGYSVVSDGRDVGSDGKTYFCREETLAHELGHNMGSQHDRVSATVDGSLKYGIYPYSFGHKAAEAAENLYTVMAYGDSGQTPYRVFSNPRTNFCGGMACGIEAEADNARSLSQTMPLISTFRSTVVPLPVPPQIAEAPLADGQLRDVDGDGRADLLWSLGDHTAWAYWTMSGPVKTGGVGYLVNRDWRVVATGDFRGDGFLDLVWTNGSSMQMWEGTSSGFVGTNMRSYPSGWALAGVGDVNGDGRVDLLWRDDASTVLSLWLMNGPVIVGSAAYSVPSPWRVLGTGNFNADNRLDVVWTDGVSMQVWLGTAQGGFAGAAMPVYPTGWQLVGIGDHDGDNRDDLIWRHPTVGQIAVWRISAGTRLSGVGFNASPAWTPISVGDHSGDGRVDLVWTDGQSMQMWLSNGEGFAGAAMVGYPMEWDSIRR